MNTNQPKQTQSKPGRLAQMDDLLKPFSVSRDGSAPYNLMCGFAKYNLDNEPKITKFCQLLTSCYSSEKKLFKLNNGLVSSYQFHIPKEDENVVTRLRFDCDLHFNYAEEKSFSQLTKLYDDVKLKKCIQIFYQVIRETIPKIIDEHLCCAILTKPFRNDKTRQMFKHGFHLEFPFIFLKNFHVKKIVSMVNFRIKDQNLFTNFFVPDNQFPSSPWCLYGQPKHGSDPTLPTYTVDKFLNYKFEEKTVEEFFEPLDKSNLVDLFWLFPRKNDTVYDFSYDYITDDVDVESDEEKDEEDEGDEEKDKNPVQLVEDMLSGLAQKRCEQTKSWRSIVCSVTNFLRENKVRERDIFNIVDNWSQQTTLGNYDRHAVQHLMDNAKYFTWCNLAVLKKYWHMDNYKEKLFLEASDDSLAKIIDDEYKGLIYFNSVNKLESYIFDEKKLLWTKHDCARALYNQVSCCLENLLGIVSKSVYKRSQDKALLKCLNNAKNRIKSDRSVNGIISRLTKYCTDTDFEDKLNSSPTLFPIKGGRVIDLATGLVRNREQTDFFTFESPVTLTDNIAFGQKFFLDLAKGEEELAVHMACLCYYFLTGLTFDRGIYQFIGEGMNGKSTLISILEILLGPLAIVGEKRSVIKDVKHGNRNDGPQPFVLAMKGKRLVIISETNNRDRLNAGNVKNLTGGDTISARKLFSNLIESFSMTAKVVVCTNHTLEFYDDDQAIKDRMKIVPFCNRFEKNQRYMDDIKKNVDGKLDSIFSYMVRVGRKVVQEQKLTRSTKVEAKTQEIFAELDIVQKFVQDMCEVCEKKDDDKDEYIESTKDLHDAYKKYCWENKIPEDEILFPSKLSKQMVSKNFCIKIKLPLPDGKFSEKTVERTFSKKDDTRLSDGRKTTVYVGLKLAKIDYNQNKKDNPHPLLKDN